MDRNKLFIELGDPNLQHLFMEIKSLYIYELLYVETLNVRKKNSYHTVNK